MATVTTVRESRRGCGYRAAGGLYLRADGINAACGLMPIPLDVCPTCHHGFKPSRGWTWIDFEALTLPLPCYNENTLPQLCERCGARKIGQAGLLWIGAKFYATPREWIKESDLMGIIDGAAPAKRKAA